MTQAPAVPQPDAPTSAPALDVLVLLVEQLRRASAEVAELDVRSRVERSAHRGDRLGVAWERLRLVLAQPTTVLALSDRVDVSACPSSSSGPVSARTVVAHNLGNLHPVACHQRACWLADLVIAWSGPGIHRIEQRNGVWVSCDEVGRITPLHPGTFPDRYQPS